MLSVDVFNANGSVVGSVGDDGSVVVDGLVLCCDGGGEFSW